MKHKYFNMLYCACRKQYNFSDEILTTRGLHLTVLDNKDRKKSHQHSSVQSEAFSKLLQNTGVNNRY